MQCYSDSSPLATSREACRSSSALETTQKTTPTANFNLGEIHSAFKFQALIAHCVDIPFPHLPISAQNVV